jgi:hypothetical protein
MIISDSYIADMETMNHSSGCEGIASWADSNDIYSIMFFA